MWIADVEASCPGNSSRSKTQSKPNQTDSEAKAISSRSCTVPKWRSFLFPSVSAGGTRRRTRWALYKQDTLLQMLDFKSFTLSFTLSMLKCDVMAQFQVLLPSVHCCWKRVRKRSGVDQEKSERRNEAGTTRRSRCPKHQVFFCPQDLLHRRGPFGDAFMLEGQERRTKRKKRRKRRRSERFQSCFLDRELSLSLSHFFKPIR